MITFEQAQELKRLNFPQKRHDHARYYINKDTIAYFEDIKNAFKTDTFANGKDTFYGNKKRQEEPVDWSEQFTYIPELEDFLGFELYDKHLEDNFKNYIDSNSSDMNENAKRVIEPLLNKDV